MSWLGMVRERSRLPEGRFSALKIALVADDLTRTALQFECQVRDVTPKNYRRVLQDWRPDILLVESAWFGHRESWRYRIASYPDHPRRNNRALSRVVQSSRDIGIPSIFWNREDGVHFDRFIDSAKLFDRVLTVDDTMLPAYKEALGSSASVATLMFAASNALHLPTWETPQRRAVFVGSYSSHIHQNRRQWQDRMFDAARSLGLDVYDRNSKRKHERYRYPELPWIDVKPAVPHGSTPGLYRAYCVNLNVNTITNSRTAFSRRLVETLACGGFVLSNRTRAIDEHFRDYCFSTDDAQEAEVLFEKVARDGLSSEQQDMRRAASEFVRFRHSWQQRLPQIIEFAES